MTDLPTTRARISELRQHIWDLDGCYALDRLIAAAAELQQAAPYFSDDECRMAKINRHLRALALAIAAQYPTQSAELRAVNMDRDRADARSKQMREDA